MPEEVCGEEKIAQRVDDESSPYHGTYPVAPVIYAQEETVLLTKIQRPLQQQVIAELDALMKANKKENWFTIYLTLFILLHSCSLTSRRDAEFAAQMVCGNLIPNHRKQVTLLMFSAEVAINNNRRMSTVFVHLLTPFSESKDSICESGSHI